jgi:hypothetical protein
MGPMLDPIQEGRQLTAVLEDAYYRFVAKLPADYGPTLGFPRDNLSWYSFPQLWGSTACGHGGIGGCAMTSAQTVIVVCSGFHDAAVYTDYRFQQWLDDSDPGFPYAMYNLQVPNAYKHPTQSPRSQALHPV